MTLTRQQLIAINKPIVSFRLRIFTTNEPLMVRNIMWKHYEKLLEKRKEVLTKLQAI